MRRMHVPMSKMRSCNYLSYCVKHVILRLGEAFSTAELQIANSLITLGGR